MAIGFNTHTINAAQGFLGGFTGMDKYLVDRRATVRQQAFNEEVRREMESFSTGYYDALNDPTKRRDFYANHPIVTANMLRRGGAGGSSKTRGIFGSGSSAAVPNIYGKFYNSRPGTAATGDGSGKTIAETSQVATQQGPIFAPNEIPTPGGEFNTPISPLTQRAFDSGNLFAGSETQFGPNLTPSQFDPLLPSDELALENFNPVPDVLTNANSQLRTNVRPSFGGGGGSVSTVFNPVQDAARRELETLAANQRSNNINQYNPFKPGGASITAPVPFVPPSPVTLVPTPTSPVDMRTLGGFFANDATIFDPLTGIPRR